jgi:nucleotide-binding universal stress UspA family protein
MDNKGRAGSGSTGERILVGVFPGQADAVVLQAAAFARVLNADLVCAWVDVSRYVVEEGPDGSVRSMPTDSDIGDVADRGLPSKLTEQLSRLLDSSNLRWSTRELAGDPARALGHFADILGAVMIVVGTRQAGMKGSLQQFMTGSTALHLAHRQHRPVVVIPLDPVPFGAPLPWESS